MTYNDTILALVTSPHHFCFPILFLMRLKFEKKCFLRYLFFFFWWGGSVVIDISKPKTVLKVQVALAKYERNGEVISINLSSWLTQDLCWDWWRWNFKEISIEYRVSHVLLLYTVWVIIYSLLRLSGREGSGSFTHHTLVALGSWCHVAVWVSHYN